MKRIVLTMVAMLMMSISQAKIVNTTIKVSNAQSKSKIENVVKRVKGVNSAVYSSKTKNLSVSYDDKKTSTKTIKATLSNAGYKMNTSLQNAKKSNSTNQKIKGVQKNEVQQVNKQQKDIQKINVQQKDVKKDNKKLKRLHRHRSTRCLFFLKKDFKNS